MKNEERKPLARRTLLFLCTGNSCRSQMAEAFARQRFPDADVFSAGIEAHGLNPHMLAVMRERGFSMDGHRSKTLAELPAETRWDLLVTVCGNAEKSCPTLPAARRVHAPFDDPPALAKTLPPGADALAVYRRVRDEIESFVERLEP